MSESVRQGKRDEDGGGGGVETKSQTVQVATWNMGGPQTKWCEFLTGDIASLYAKVVQTMEDPKSPMHKLSALKCFTSARRRLNSALIDTSLYKTEQIHKLVQLWSVDKQGMTLFEVLTAHELEDPSDTNRKYSWADRHFLNRPTLINSDSKLDPATFTCTGTHGLIPHFRRFEEAWIQFMFAKTPKGTLVQPMPTNKYVVKNGSDILGPLDIQILSYLDLFFYDWCITACVYFMEHTYGFASFFTDREAAIRNRMLEVRPVHQVQFVSKLAKTHTVIGLQEVSPKLLQQIQLVSGLQVATPQTPAEQMTIQVFDSNHIQVRIPNVFMNVFPESSILSSRVLGTVVELTRLKEQWLFVSAHCEPIDLHPLMDFIQRTMKLPKYSGIVGVVLTGDFNIQRDQLIKLAQTCRPFGFASTWNPLVQVPNTVCNMRVKWLQTQLAKGGHQNTHPKDHILVWKRDGFIPQSDVRVIIDDDLTAYNLEDGEPNPLIIGLPSDHAALSCEFVKWIL